MKSCFKSFSIIVFISGVLLAGCSRSEDATRTLVVALKPDKNPDAMMDDRSALKSYLEEQLGKPVEIKIPASGSVIEQGLANGTIDLAYLSSTNAAQFFEQGTAELLLAGEIDGNPYYQSYWVSLKEKPYTSIADLRGKPISFASPTSTSGYIIPTWDLHQKGLIAEKQNPEAFFGSNNILFGTGYVSAIQYVLEGNAEAAAVSDYVIDEDKHLTNDQKAKLRVIQSQGPVPSHILAVRSNLNLDEKEMLKAALLRMNVLNPELRDRVFTSTLIEVNETEHLKPIREALDFISNLP